MSNNFPHPFKGIASKYRTLRDKLPREISVIALNEFKGHFRVSGYYSPSGGFIGWKKRAKEEGGAKRALLIKSGRLRRGLQVAPTFNSARVINDVPYAAIHNEGGKINAVATVRSFNRKNGVKVKSHRRKMNTSIPARPFMIDTGKLFQKIDAHIENRLKSLFDNA